jgi:hypothetical protein
VRKLKSLYDRLPRFLRNKYALTTLAFLAWMLFFDAHGIVQRLRGIRELREAKAQVQYYKKQIAQTQKDLNMLFSSPESMERFARERFYLKKDNEEIFLIEEEQ